MHGLNSDPGAGFPVVELLRVPIALWQLPWLFGVDAEQGAFSHKEAVIAQAFEFGIGAILVVLVLSDIFRTILLPHPTHRALRLEPVLGKAFVPVWLSITGKLPRTRMRQTLRAILGPLLIVLSLAIWVGALNFGYALMLHARPVDIQPTPSFFDAYYYASSSFLTLGLEGAHATGLARVVIMAAGFTGLANVTIVATFLLSVQSAIDRREVLVLSLATVAGRPPSGLSILETYARAGLSGSLAALFQDWEKWSADVLHSHRANPVLAHFRSSDEDDEWLAAFAAVLDAACLLLTAVDTSALPQPKAMARLLVPMGKRTIGDFAELFQIDSSDRLGDVCDRESFRQVCGCLKRAGYALVDQEDEAWRQFNALRNDYHPQLLGLCRHFGIELPHRLTQDTHPGAEDVL